MVCPCFLMTKPKNKQKQKTKQTNNNKSTFNRTLSSTDGQHIRDQAHVMNCGVKEPYLLVFWLSGIYVCINKSRKYTIT